MNFLAILWIVCCSNKQRYQVVEMEVNHRPRQKEIVIMDLREFLEF